MRLPILPAVILILLNIFIDWYIYGILKRRFGRRGLTMIHSWLAVLLQVLVIVAICLPRRGGDNDTLLTIMWMLYGYLTVYTSKLVFVITDLISRIPKLFGRRSWHWLAITGAISGCIVFAAMWWGALHNRLSLQVKEVEIPVSGLPERFEGFRIAQISDLHVGTFGNDTSFVSRLVDRVNSLRPDIIVFTGDIVNTRSSELRPHVMTLHRLKAPSGVYSILGNHDYGDYSDWPNSLAKEDNLSHIKYLQKEMGWRLLLNETEFLHRGSDSIAIIGVENIGDPPFKVYGSLTKAYPTLSDNVTKVLLTHNPAHWTDSIAGHYDVNIPLTLSGHTHAMQMEIGGWSPARWRYPTWGGLYTDSDTTHCLYVNIGDGTVAFPARIGATPEITILTLKKR